MKQLCLLLFMITTWLMSSAQNGGQYAENNSVKVEQLVGLVNSKMQVKVYNKQDCNVTIRISYGNTHINVFVSSNSSKVVLIPLNITKIQVKTETNCGCADFGQVELQLNKSLPITFKYLNVTRIGNEYNVTFEASSTDGEGQFNIQVSSDGINFKTVAIILPDPIVVNKIYNIKIKL